MAPSPGPRRPISRRRKWLFRLVLATLLLLTTIGLLEVYLRSSMSSFQGPAFNLPSLYQLDENGWPAMVPDYEGEVFWAGRTTHIRLNEHGMRDQPLEPKAPGTRRVLAVGDSMMFGLGVEAEETFADRLERSLDDHGPIEIVNAAAPGYGTFDLGVLVEKHRDRVDPDLILAGIYLGNDFDDNARVSRTVLDGALLWDQYARTADRSLRLRMAIRSRVWYCVENFITRNLPQFAVAIADGKPEAEAYRDFPSILKQRIGAFFLDRVPETDGTRRILDRLEAALAKLVEAAGPTPVVAIVLPRIDHLDETRYRARITPFGWDGEYVRGTTQRRVAERCEKLGITCLDLTPALAAVGAPAEVFLRDKAHFSVRGHQVVADHLAPKLAAWPWRE